MTTNFNWSWIKSLSETLRRSISVDQSGGIIYSYRAAERGVLSSAELRTSIDSIGTNINQQWRLWQNNIRPILDSLPSGARDQRWRSGKGLPTKIDSLNYGVQGTTLFVFNDSDAVKASGRYWHVDDERPLTIAEALEDLWDALNNLETGTSDAAEDQDLDPLWRAIGHHYKDSSLVSIASSLDARVSTTESYLNQLRNDLFGNNQSYTSWTFGVPLVQSVAKNIDYLLQIHNVTGWQSDPSDVSHEGVSGEYTHQHPYTDILPMPSSALSQGRTIPYTSLYNDILRLRYEIQETRGSTSWYTDANDPVTSSAGSLSVHMNYAGNGTVSITNPHGLNYEDVGVDVLLTNIANFIGMSDYTVEEFPSYSSVNYITQNGDLENAISELDSAINNSIAGFVTSAVYGPFDRSSLTEEQREATPIIIAHSKGALPASVNVVDLNPESESSEGMFSSPLVDVISDFPDVNTVNVWTTARIVTVTLIFNGSASASLTEIGGVTLNGAYNYGGSGNGSSVIADNGAVTITSTSASGNNVLELAQNDTTNSNHVLVIGSNNDSSVFTDDAYAVYLNGSNSAGQTIWSNNILNIGSLYDSEFKNSLSFGSSVSLVAENISTGDSEIVLSSIGGASGDGYLSLSADYLLLGTSTTGVIGFSDINFDASSWSADYLSFAETQAEYDLFKTNFTEVSVLSSLNSLYTFATGSFDFIEIASGTYSFSNNRNSCLGVSYSATGTTAITLTTPSSVEGRMVIIKDTGGNASGNTITIDTEAAQTIEGSSSITITSDNGSLTLIYDGVSNWMSV